MSEWYQCPSFAQSSWKGGIQNCTGPDEGTEGRKAGTIPHRLCVGDQTITDPLQDLCSWSDQCHHSRHTKGIIISIELEAFTMYELTTTILAS